MKVFKILALTALASTATFAVADEKVVTEDGVATFSTFKPAAVRAEVGTTGYGGAISWNPNPYVGVTLGYNGGEISWTDDVKIDGNTYDLDMDNNLTYLNAEIRPWANWFYVAAGVGYLDNEYEVSRTIKSGNGFSVNDNDYIAVSDVEIAGNLDYDNKIAPYLGLGFSPSITNRWGVFGEVGAYYSGNPNVNLTSTGTATTVSGNGLANDVQSEENEIANDDQFEWFPVAKLGVTYRF
ncbi:ornithine uptake porin CarO [Acinetobacter sp. A3.8]|uniref:Ornithine uptake porin CarO n=1 Tax=Acinetobacter sedimenti TaxID=2919922 RepID=A0A9X1X181_9GAMM|nr:ornithine uptake porin CarO [Acinetobacter sedimenti]MCJ8147200.1 ornithine uptake porin CarO [Acinetobacter sedimenti]